jgi:hypothetical protein
MPQFGLQNLLNRSQKALPVFLLAAFTACSSSPTSPLEISKLSLGVAYDVYVRGETAYVSNNHGVVVLDISDINHPRRISRISENSTNSTNSIVFFHVSGDTLFTYGERFSSYDIHEREDPQLLESLSGRDYIAGARRWGNYLYLGYLHGGLEVFDLQEPSTPVSLGYAPSPSRIDAIELEGDYVYIANSHTGLEVFDVTEPTNPTRLGAVPGTSGAMDIQIRDNLLYLACNIYGVKILDISDPAAPEIIGSFSNGGETWGVFAQGPLLYTVDLAQGVEVLDISSPTHPALLMRDRNYHPHDVFADGRYLYLADQDESFVVLPLEWEEIS